MGHELQRADGVGDTLEVVALSVREVIHRVGVPLGAGAVVRRVYDAVHHRVAEVHIGVGHVELSPEHHASLHSLGCVHLGKQLQVFLHGAVAVWACHSRSCRCSLLLCYLFRGLLVDVCHTFLYHPHCEVPQLLEVVGGVIHVAPLESEPLYVVEYRVNVFRVFL